MFEIIKIIAEAIAKSLSPQSILSARKEHRLNEIGTELFLLYSLINDILAVGYTIVDELEGALRRMERRIEEGNIEETTSTHLDIQLLQQRINLQRLAEAIIRFSYELKLLSPEVYRQLGPILAGKDSAIRAIWRDLAHQRISSAEQEAIEKWMHQYADALRSGRSPMELPRFGSVLARMQDQTIFGGAQTARGLR